MLPFCRPVFLALVVTLANAAKPLVVDDTAYLTYARHIATNPLDPYGFDIFWYTVPSPAFEVLAPPVVPYWLALGVRLFGEQPVPLKLWLFPFVWTFAWAVAALLCRFARGTESRLLPLLVLSPAVLPTVNLMLDIPAFGLGLAALVVFLRAADRGSGSSAVAAGLVAGLAMQTKYTALLVPPVLLWYGLTHRRFRLAVLATGVAVAVFVGWELLLVGQYGRSHFAFHTQDQAGGAGFRELVRQKFELLPPLAGHLGCLGIGVGFVAAGVLGLPRRWLGFAAVVWWLGFAAVLLLPNRVTGWVVVPFWTAFGFAVLAAVAGCAGLLAVRWGKGVGLRRNWDADFLVGWLAIECAGYFVLTPFPAARRVIGVVVVGGLLVARVLRMNGWHRSPDRWSAVTGLETGATGPLRRVKPPGWVVGFGITAGFAVAALDTLDAYPEKVCAEEAAVLAATRSPGATVWFVGHWGFQYYCERVGMRPVVPGRSVLVPGDVLVLPVYPDETGFYRPHVGSVAIRPPPGAVERIGEVVWDDVVAGQTIPNFYGGVAPVMGCDHPRLRVVVSRVTAKWDVKRNGS